MSFCYFLLLLDEWFPFKTACELSGISESELSEVVLAGIGKTNEGFGANHLFSLVGVLAEKLTKSEVVEALSFGLDLFDAILEDKDGDGPWSPELAPPADFDATVAGYVWACLAAPEAALRWEAAHVVRALCTLGLTDTLGQMVAFATGGSPRAFVDAHLHFYALHARLWLLIGLARAAKEYPKLIVPHIEFLKGIVFAGEPHVLMREFAKRTLIALLNAGVWVPDADMCQRLYGVNTSPFPPIESKSYRRVERSLGPDNSADGFAFGIDIGPHWFAPLGRCFATAQTDIERMALQIIKGDWRISGGARWDDDERQRRGIYRGNDTRHHRTSYPRMDELRFYFSYHAMMVVAGKLLASIPVHHDPDYSEDDFHGWLRRHDLTRRNGGWLADRRDPFPLEKLAWKAEKENDEWRWSTMRSDFDQVLFPPDGRMNLWCHWTRISGRRKESIDVASALVSSSRSAALLIPDANDDLQIDFDGFQLKG